MISHKEGEQATFLRVASGSYITGAQPYRLCASALSVVSGMQSEVFWVRIAMYGRVKTCNESDTGQKSPAFSNWYTMHLSQSECSPTGVCCQGRSPRTSELHHQGYGMSRRLTGLTGCNFLRCRKSDLGCEVSK